MWLPAVQPGLKFGGEERGGGDSHKRPKEPQGAAADLSRGGGLVLVTFDRS